MSTSLHKTLLAANLQCEGLSSNQHLRIWIDSLVVVDGHTPLLFFTRSKFLCTRASISFDRYSLFHILFISVLELKLFFEKLTVEKINKKLKWLPRSNDTVRIFGRSNTVRLYT